MSSKTKIIIEFSLTATLLFIHFLSYFLDKYRMTVLILGILYCLLFLGQLILSVNKLRRKEAPFGIIITIVGLVLLQNDGNNSNYLVVENHFSAWFIILTIVIITIILISAFYLCLKKTWKEDWLSFVIISILLSLGSVLYGLFPLVNYSFDMSQTKTVEVTVSQCVGEDNLRGAFFDTHYLYNIESPDDIQINAISIDSDYKIDINTPILIKYRQGVFCQVYKIDYSGLTSIEDEYVKK